MIAQPPIDAFLPKQKLDESSHVTIEDLQHSISRMEVTQAIEIYKLLENTTINEISDDLKLSLLELVCFFNHVDPIPIQDFEERVVFDVQARKQGSIWLDGSIGDQLFKDIEATTPVAYNAMIRGLAKHKSALRALELFRKAESKQIPLDCSTYNAYISCIFEENQSLQYRRSEIIETFSKMNHCSIRPNVHTLHAAVAALSGGHSLQVREIVEPILGEFRRMGILPMLSTYSLLLHMYAALPTNTAAIEAILDEIECLPRLEIQSLNDMQFFHKAMEIFRFRIKESKSYVHRIDKIARDPKNINLLGDTVAQQLYYRHFLCTVLRQESWTDFFNVYNELVPMRYNIEPLIADELISKINVTGAIQYVPILWKDMVTAEISKRDAVVEALLRLMLLNKPYDEIPQQKGLDQEFGKIATDMATAMKADQENVNRNVMLNSSSLSSILILQLRGQMFKEARDVFEMCMEHEKKGKLVNPLSELAVTDFLNVCIEKNHPRPAVEMFKYGISHNMIYMNQYATKLLDSKILAEDEENLVRDLIGHGSRSFDDDIM